MRRLLAQIVYPPSGVDLSGDNVIEFSSTTSGGFVVTAYNSTKTVQINQSVYGFGDSLRIDAGGGNDLVQPAPGTVAVKPLFLIGNVGNDTLVGSDANDTLDGSSGNDLLAVNNGNDTLLGGAGTDTVTGVLLASSSAQMFYKLDGTSTPNDYVIVGSSIVKTDNVDAENLIGGPGNDELLGSGSANLLDGGSGGNDSLYGGSGNDTLYGESGNDYADGGPGTDFVRGYAGNDTLVGGSGAADYLQGDDGNDRFNLADIFGSQDTGVGGAGNDVLDASDSDDVFIQ